ncbi:hypothetical protein CRENBAI_011164 [Crenichthys baileyi]|uniref:Uncharacterized protein n=1 Tax=Crenichthys baileyi TaxID=28760 RepID=A0AAV9RFL2_9TELE
MLPASLHSGVLHLASPNRMFPPNTDPADEQKADALDRWVQCQMEEAMRHLPKDLEVLPSPLLLDQMEREAAQRQRRSLPAPVPAAKPSSSSRRKNRRRAGVNSRSAGEEESATATVVMPAVVVSLPASHAVFARSSPPQERCPRQVFRELLQLSPRHVPRTVLLQSSPHHVSRVLLLLQSSPRQVSRVLLLQSNPRIVSRVLLLQLLLSRGVRGWTTSDSGTWTHLDGVPVPTDSVPGRTDAQSDSKPVPKSASTSSTRRRGRRKRDDSAQVIGCPGNASASAHATEGLGDASASAHATEGLGDASASAHATEGLGDALASAHATEGLGDASASAHAAEGLGDASAHVTEGLGDASASTHATNGSRRRLSPRSRH